jgi:hypothetical protein
VEALVSPTKIMIIRHAEKPVPDGADGVDLNGLPDPKSLSLEGWERAKKLVEFFQSPTAAHIQKPDFVFAAAPDIGSKRPAETVTPLARALWGEPIPAQRFNSSVPKENVQGLANAVMRVDGAVLVCWEHKLIPSLVSALPDAPATPIKWRGDRFDVVWILNAKPGGWDFQQTPQMLLAGDQNLPIPF